jgi:hypothetical protein
MLVERPLFADLTTDFSSKTQEAAKSEKQMGETRT